MWNRILGKSTGNGKESSTAEGRQKGENQSSTPRRADSTKSTSSSRKPRQNDDGDRGFNPTSTSYSSTSRYQYPGTAAASIGSSYATASSGPTNEPYLPPGLVRNASLADQMPTSLAGDDSRTAGLESSSKSKREKVEPESMDRKRDRKERRGTRDGNEERKEGKSGRDKKTRKNSGGRSERAMSADEIAYISGQRSSETPRVSDRYGENSVSVAQSGQYSTIGPQSTPVQPPPQSSHVQDQFPGQFPAQAAAPYRPPLAASEGGPGLAAEYYGDAGQSVADQPGFRKHSPSLIIGAEPHLQAASAVAAPPPEPSTSGGVGAAASFFDGSFNAGSDLEDHHGHKPTSTSGSSGPPYSSAAPLASTYATSSAAPTYHSASSAPAIPTLGAAAAGAAAGYYMSNNSSKPAQPVHESASVSGYGRISGSSEYHHQHSGIHDSYTVHSSSDRPPTRPAGAAGVAAAAYSHDHHGSSSHTPHAEHHDGGSIPHGSFDRPSTRPHKYSSQSSHIPLYAAGAAGVAGAAYHHNHHGSSNHTSHAEHTNGGSMAQQHRRRHHGPFAKLIDFFQDPDGVAQFEEYTEAIGVCKHCFAPGSSPRDAPRKHHYRRRHSNERIGSNVRVDKESRYWSSENENRRRKNKSWLEAGIAGYGLGKASESLFGQERDFDDRHSVKSGRVRRSHRRGSSSSSERKSYTSGGIINRSSDTLSRQSPSHGRAENGVTSDGKLYRKDSHGHIKTTAIKSHSGHRSRSSSRERKHKASDVVLGAAIGSTTIATTSRNRSRSPKKAFVRSKHGHDEKSSELASVLKLHESGSHDSHPRSRHSPDRMHRNGRKKEKKSKGFFNFSNGSSSSSGSSSLAFGAGHDHKSTRSAKSKKRNRDNWETDAALLAGAAAAALALNQSQRSRHKGELVAVKEKHKPGKHDHKGKKQQSNSEEELWESASEGERSSADSGMAYGASLHRRSQESLSSESSGLDKWSWRWGSKKTSKDRRRSSGTDHVKPVTAASAGVAGAAQIPSKQWQDSRMTSTSSIPMQYVHPMPTSDPTQFDIARHEDPRAPPYQPLMSTRPDPVPIQHPQPVAPVSSSVYTTHAPFPHSYSAPTDPSTFVQPPHPSSIPGQPHNDIPGAFPTGSEYFEPFIKDSPKHSKPRRRDTSPITLISDPTSSSSTGPRRRKSLKDDSSVRFDLTKEQEEKDRRDERRRRKEEDKRRERLERQESEERRKAEHFSRPERGTSRRESISRSHRESREESSETKGDSWAAPAAAGAVAAIVSATVAAEKSRKEHTNDPEHDVRDIEVTVKERRAADKAIPAEDIEGRGRSAKKESVWQAAAKIRRSSSHTDYAAYFTPSEVLSKDPGAKETVGPNADADVAVHRIPHVITVEPSDFSGNTPSRAYSFPVTDEDMVHNKNPLPWAVPILNLVEPTPPASRSGSVVGSRSPQSRSPLSKEVVVEIPLEPLESVVDTDIKYTQPEHVKYAVIEPKERSVDPAVDSPVSEINITEAVPGISSLKNRNTRKKSPPKVDYGDDLDFTATVAAGLQDTGFNPSIVIDDPSFRRRDSPLGSEDDEISNRRTGFVTGMQSDIPCSKSPPHGFVEEIPEHHMPGSFDDEEEQTVEFKLRGEDEPISNEFTGPSDNVGIKPHVYTVEPDASETTDIKNATVDPVGTEPTRKRESVERDHEREELTGPSDNAAIEPHTYSALPRSFEPEAVSNATIDVAGAGSDNERRAERHQPVIEAATEPADNVHAKPQIYTAEPDSIDPVSAHNVTVDPGSEDRQSRSPPNEVPQSQSLNDSPDIIESLSDEAPSIAASAPVITSSKRDSKSSKKSKRRSVGFDDTASAVSSPATYGATSESSPQSKKGRKGGIFGLFGKSTENPPEAKGSQGTAVEASLEDFEEPKKRSKKSKNRKTTLDNDEFSTITASEPVLSGQAETQDDWSTSKKSKRGKEKRRSSEGTSAQDSGRITQDLPAQVMAPASHGHDHLPSSNEKLTNPEDQEIGRSPYHPGLSGDVDYVADQIRAHNGQQPSFLGERLEQPRSPELPDTSEDPGGQPRLDQPPVTVADPQSSEPRVDSPTTRADKQKWRLSDIQSNGRSASYSSPSPTAIPLRPLRFGRRPSSPGPTKSLPSTPEPSTAVDIPFTPRRRERPHSTEFKSNEIRPMWLLEKHGSRQEPAPQEVYPSLPSSHSTSRASSIHESDDLDQTRTVDDAFLRFSFDQTTSGRRGLAIDTKYREIEPELLDSQQATPTAASFHSILKDGNDETHDPQSSPTMGQSKPDVVGISPLPEAYVDPLVGAPEEKRLLHGVNDLFPRPRSTSPSRYEAVLEKDISPRSEATTPLSPTSGKEEHGGFKSLLEDAALGAFIGGSAATLLKSRSQHDEQLERYPKDADKEEDPEQKELPLPETAKSSSTRPTAEELRLRQEQDAQDAVDSWFAPPSPKKSRDGKKGKKRGKSYDAPEFNSSKGPPAEVPDVQQSTERTADVQLTGSEQSLPILESAVTTEPTKAFATSQIEDPTSSITFEQAANGAKAESTGVDLEAALLNRKESKGGKKKKNKKKASDTWEDNAVKTPASEPAVLAAIDHSKIEPEIANEPALLSDIEPSRELEDPTTAEFLDTFDSAQKGEKDEERNSQPLLVEPNPESPPRESANAESIDFAIHKKLGTTAADLTLPIAPVEADGGKITTEAEAVPYESTTPEETTLGAFAGSIEKGLDQDLDVSAVQPSSQALLVSGEDGLSTSSPAVVPYEFTTEEEADPGTETHPLQAPEEMSTQQPGHADLQNVAPVNPTLDESSQDPAFEVRRDEEHEAQGPLSSSSITDPAALEKLATSDDAVLSEQGPTFPGSELQVSPEAIPLPFNDDLDLLEALPESPILQPVDAVQSAEFADGQSNRALADSALSQGLMLPSHHDPTEVMEKSVSWPLHVEASVEKSLASPDAAPATLTKVISELNLPESAVGPAVRGDEVSVANAIPETEISSLPPDEPKELTLVPQDQPGEEWPSFTGKKGKKGKRVRKDKSVPVEAEMPSSNLEQAEQDPDDLLSSTKGDVSFVGEPVAESSLMDQEWPSSEKQKKKGKKSKKVKFDDFPEPQPEMLELATTLEPPSATTSTAKDVEDLLSKSEKEGVELSISHTTMPTTTIVEHDTSDDSQKMPSDDTELETVIRREEPSKQGTEADLPEEPSSAPITVPSDLQKSLSIPIVDLLPERTRGTFMEDQNLMSSEDAAASTSTAAEVQEMLAQERGPENPIEPGEDNVLNPEETEADKFARAPSKKQKSKKPMSRAIDIAVSADADTPVPEESIKGEVSANKDLLGNEPFEEFAVKKSKKDKKNKRQNMQRSDTDFQEAEEPPIALELEKTPEVEQMTIMHDAPSILEKTDKLPNIEVPASPQMPSSAALPSDIALPEPESAPREPSLTEIAENVDVAPGLVAQETPTLTEGTSHMPDSREMEISAAAPSIFETNDQLLGAKETSMTEALQPHSPVISNDDAALVDATKEELDVPTTHMDQLASPTEPKATLLPIEEPSSFADLEDIGIANAAPSVQVAYNGLPDVEPTTTASPVGEDNTVSRSVEEAHDQPVVPANIVEEPAFQPLLGKKDKKKAKKAKAIAWDDEPAALTPTGESELFADPVKPKDGSVEPEFAESGTSAKGKKDKKSKKSNTLDWVEEPTTPVSSETLTPSDNDELREETAAPQALPLEAESSVSAPIDQDLPISKKDKKKVKKAKALGWKDDALKDIQLATEELVEPMLKEDAADTVDATPKPKKEKKKSKKAKILAWEEGVPEELTEDKSSQQQVIDPPIDQSRKLSVEEPPAAIDVPAAVEEGSQQTADRQIEENGGVLSEQPVSKKGKKKSKKSSFMASDEESATLPSKDETEQLGPLPAEPEAIANISIDPGVQQSTEPPDDQPTSKKSKKKGRKSRLTAWEEPDQQDPAFQPETAPESVVAQPLPKEVTEVVDEEAVSEKSKKKGKKSKSVAWDDEPSTPSTRDEDQRSTELHPTTNLPEVQVPSNEAALEDLGLLRSTSQQGAVAGTDQEVIDLDTHRLSGNLVAELSEPTLVLSTNAANLLTGEHELPPASTATGDVELQEAVIGKVVNDTGEEGFYRSASTPGIYPEPAPSPSAADIALATEALFVPPEDVGMTVNTSPKMDDRENVLPPVSIAEEELRADENGLPIPRDKPVEEASGLPLHLNEDPVPVPSVDDALSVAESSIPVPSEPAFSSTHAFSEIHEEEGVGHTSVPTTADAFKIAEEIIPDPFEEPKTTEADIPANVFEEPVESIPTPADDAIDFAEEFRLISKKDKKSKKAKKAMEWDDEATSHVPEADPTLAEVSKEADMLSDQPTEPSSISVQQVTEIPPESKKDKKRSKTSKVLLLDDDVSGTTTPAELEQGTPIGEPTAEVVDEFPAFSKKDRKKSKKNKALMIEDEAAETIAPMEFRSEPVTGEPVAAGEAQPEPVDDFSSMSKKDRKKSKKTKALLLDDEPFGTTTPMELEPRSSTADLAPTGQLPEVLDDFPSLSKKDRKKSKKNKALALDDEPNRFTTTPLEIVPESSTADLEAMVESVPTGPPTEAFDEFPSMNKKDRKKSKKSQKGIALDDEPSLDTTPVGPEAEPAVDPTPELDIVEQAAQEPSVATETSIAQVIDGSLSLDGKDGEKGMKSTEAIAFDDKPSKSTDPVDAGPEFDIIAKVAEESALAVAPSAVASTDEFLPMTKDKKKAKKSKKRMCFHDDPSETTSQADPAPEFDIVEQAAQGPVPKSEPDAAEAVDELPSMSRKDKKKGKKGKKAIFFDDEPSGTTTPMEPITEAHITEEKLGDVPLPPEIDVAETVDDLPAVSKKDKKKSKKSKKAFSFNDKPSESTTPIETIPETDAAEAMATEMPVLATSGAAEGFDEFPSMSKKDKKKAKKDRKASTWDDGDLETPAIVEAADPLTDQPQIPTLAVPVEPKGDLEATAEPSISRDLSRNPSAAELTVTGTYSDERRVDDVITDVPMPTTAEALERTIGESEKATEPEFEDFVGGKKSKKDKKRANKTQTPTWDEREPGTVSQMPEIVAYTGGGDIPMPEAEMHGRLDDPIIQEPVGVVKSLPQEEMFQDFGQSQIVRTLSPSDLPIDTIREVPEENDWAAPTEKSKKDKKKRKEMSRNQSFDNAVAEQDETAGSVPLVEESKQRQNVVAPAVIPIIEQELAPRHQDPAMITPAEIVNPEIPTLDGGRGHEPDVLERPSPPAISQMETKLDPTSILQASPNQVPTFTKEMETDEPTASDLPTMSVEQDDGFESFAPTKKSKKGKKTKKQPLVWEEESITPSALPREPAVAREGNVPVSRPEMAAWPTEVRLNQTAGMDPVEEQPRSPVVVTRDSIAREALSPPNEPLGPPPVEEDRGDYFSHSRTLEDLSQPTPLNYQDDVALANSTLRTVVEEPPFYVHNEITEVEASQPDTAQERAQQPPAITEQPHSQEPAIDLVDDFQGSTPTKKDKKSKKKKKATADDIMWEFPAIPPAAGPNEADEKASVIPEVAMDPLSAELLRNDPLQAPPMDPSRSQNPALFEREPAIPEQRPDEDLATDEWGSVSKESKKGKKSKKGKTVADDLSTEHTADLGTLDQPSQSKETEVDDNAALGPAREFPGSEQSGSRLPGEIEPSAASRLEVDEAIATAATMGAGVGVAQQLGRKESKKGKKSKKSRQASSTWTEEEEVTQPPTNTFSQEPELVPSNRAVTPERRSPIQAWHQYISPSQSPKQSELYEVLDDRPRSITSPRRKQSYNRERSQGSTPERRSPIEAWHQYNPPRRSPQHNDFDEHDSSKMRGRSAVNRDSAVHVADSPMVPQRSPVHRVIRDSGYPETEASPVVGMESEHREYPQEAALGLDDIGRERRHEATDENALHISSANLRGQRDKIRERSRSPSQQERGYQDIDLPTQPIHRDRFAEELREPSPVSSTTRNRSSVLFHSSPSTRAEQGNQEQVDPPMEDNSAVVNARAESLAALSGLRGPGQDQQRPSLFGGPIGHSSDGTPPATPLDHDSTNKRRLNTITEYSPDESPLHNRDRDLSDVGAPEHGVKAARRSGTPQDIAKRRSRVRSPPMEYRRESHSPDEHLSRLSGPCIEGGKDTINVERSRSRGIDQQRPSSRQSNISSLVSGQPKQREYERRSLSGASNRSIESINAIIRTPPDQMRSASGMSNRSSGTPPLRRSDRSVSGDLRGANRKSVEAKKGAKTAEAEAEIAVPSSTNNDNDTGRRKSRVKEMADVFEGYGDFHGSPLSPTRPPSMRRRQSMQVLELESKLDQLAAENRSLFDAKSRAERGLEEIAHGREQEISSYREGIESRDVWLQQKDTELTQLKETLGSLQGQVEELREVNEGLHASSRELDDHQERYGQLEEEHADTHQRWQQSTRELEDLRQQHSQLSAGMEDIVRHEVNIAVEEKNAELHRLQSELEAAKDQIRTLQQQILASKRTSPDSSLLAPERDEDYFDAQCQSLCQHVQQWVLRFSKFSDSRACYLASEVRDEKIVDRMENAILDGSDVDAYLADRVKRRDVFMSMVMTMTWEFIFTRYLFGADREQRQKLKSLEKTLMEQNPISAVHRWRATTLQLLSRRDRFREQRAQDTEAVGQNIFATLAAVLPPPSHLVEQIQSSLRKVLAMAVDLSIEMRTQRAEYVMLPPLQPEYDTNGDLARKVYFNAALMNERSGNVGSNEELEAKEAVVRMVLFPLVVRKGGIGEEGEGEEIVVCPAQVLVAGGEGDRKGKRVASRPLEGGDVIMGNMF
ncbi:MAG: hypothetical protein Q9218_002549 [Villophora microphyllina]